MITIYDYSTLYHHLSLPISLRSSFSFPLFPLLNSLLFLSLSLSLTNSPSLLSLPHSLSPPFSPPPPLLPPHLSSTLFIPFHSFPSPLSPTLPISHLPPYPSSTTPHSLLPLSSHTRNAPYIPIDTLLFVPFSTGGVNNPNSYTHVHTVQTLSMEHFKRKEKKRVFNYKFDNFSGSKR